MRTTLDLPDQLARRAKLAAVRRGVPFKQLVAEALEQQLESGKSKSANSTLSLPLIRSRDPGSMKLSPDQIDAILLREEIASYEAAGRH